MAHWSSLFGLMLPPWWWYTGMILWHYRDSIERCLVGPEPAIAEELEEECKHPDLVEASIAPSPFHWSLGGALVWFDWTFPYWGSSALCTIVKVALWTFQDDLSGVFSQIGQHIAQEWRKVDSTLPAHSPLSPSFAVALHHLFAIKW
jgi:hypothetical protein